MRKQSNKKTWLIALAVLALAAVIAKVLTMSRFKASKDHVVVDLVTGDQLRVRDSDNMVIARKASGGTWQDVTPYPCPF